jgi:hypothetical protein
MTTVVTCYYRIPSKHSYSSYDQWIENFMNLKMNTVIYVNTDSITYLKLKYPESPTRKYKIREFHEFTNIKYDWNREILLNRKPHPGHNPTLFLIWSEKIHFVNDAINTNPYNSDCFVWMDIGCVRNKSWLNRISDFPNINKIDLHHVNFLQMNPWKDNDFEKAKIITPEQFYNRDPVIGGTIFAGGIKPLLKFREIYIDVLEEAHKNNVFKGEDQDLYSFCILRHPELFKLYNPLYVGYDEWFSLHLYWSNYFN